MARPSGPTRRPVHQADFLGQVFRICAEHRVLHHWCADARRCLGTRGIPDLILCGSHHVIFREVKQDSHDSPSSYQVTWLYALRGAGMDTGVWHYADLDNGTVEREIGALNHA